MFGQYAENAGKTNDDAHAHYGRYEKAVRDGNSDLMKDLIADAKSWSSGMETASDTATSSMIADAKSVGAQFKHLTATEAYELEKALAELGPTAARTFTKIHNGALHTGTR